jgi:dUTP pyrophosphatase
MVKLENSSKQPFQVNIGDRIAQLILYYISQPSVKHVTELNNTARNDKGFGSSGTHVNRL